MELSQLAGAWKLRSFEITPTEGATRPWGEEVSGLLLYTADGHMSVSINRKVAGDGAKEILDSILFYSGRFQVGGSDEVVHEVTHASKPDRVGKKHVRKAKLEGNQLTLTSPPESFGTAQLVWERMAHE